MRRYYHATDNWAHLLGHLRANLPRSLRDKADLLIPTPEAERIRRRRVPAPDPNSSAARAKAAPPPWHQGALTNAAGDNSAAQKGADGRVRLKLKPRDPILDQPTALQSAANRRGVSQPAPRSPTNNSQIISQCAKRASAPQRDPATGRQKLILQPRTSAAPSQPQPQVQPVAQAASLPSWQTQPRTQLQVTSATAKAPAPTTAIVMPAPGPALQTDPSGGRPRLVLKKREEPAAAPAPVQAAPAVQAVSPRNAVAAPRLSRQEVIVPSGPALQRDATGGRPKLVLKPRTAPALAQ